MPHSEVRTIQPGEPFWKFHWAEVWDYRSLLKFLLLRDIRLTYKQTILGPVHLFLRPIIMTVVFQLVFSGVGKIPTDGIHPFLFYFANHVMWAFYSGVFTSSSTVFSGGKGLMGKVYFPRIIPVFSSTLMNAFKLAVQLLLFFGVFFSFAFTQNGKMPSLMSLAIFVPILQLALFGIGVGLLFSCLTLRYRDLNSLSGIILQGMMYLSPVIFPFSVVPEKYHFIASLNPIASAMESFRYFVFGKATLSVQLLGLGYLVTVLVFFAGVFSFNLIQRKFIDIV